MRITVKQLNEQLESVGYEVVSDGAKKWAVLKNDIKENVFKGNLKDVYIDILSYCDVEEKQETINELSVVDFDIIWNDVNNMLHNMNLKDGRKKAVEEAVEKNGIERTYTDMINSVILLSNSYQGYNNLWKHLIRHQWQGGDYKSAYRKYKQVKVLKNLA